MADNIDLPSVRSVRKFVNGFDWDTVSEMEETLFGFMYEQEWSMARCGIARHIEVRYGESFKIACKKCFANLIHEDAVGYAKQEHVIFPKVALSSLCFYCGRNTVEDLLDVRACRGCLTVKYRQAETVWARFRERLLQGNQANV